MRKKSNATRIVLVILLIGAFGLMGWRRETAAVKRVNPMINAVTGFCSVVLDVEQENDAQLHAGTSAEAQIRIEKGADRMYGGAGIRLQEI
ncbi:MAG: hypothetical protein LBO82_08175 [Synergistaceae bacterium]|jgi:hypothetical protein|nr:hypothetical protein [Synergistaceae bacterium]